MSVDQPTPPEAIELPASGDAQFAALMDVLVSSEDPAPAAQGDPPADAAGGGAGQPAAADEGAAAAGAAPAAQAAGAPAVAGVPTVGAGEAGGAAASGGDGRATAAGAVDAAQLAPKWGEISTALETRQAETAQTAALDAVRQEYPKYFDALNKHPRLLIGQEVPAIGREGTETLRDSQDAAEWQEAVKAVLIEEVKDRALRLAEDGGTDMQVLHASIELFQNNADLIPGTKQFDRELAEKFVELAAPYALKVDGKLRGYTIPPQPLVNQLRTQLAAARAAAPAGGTVAPAAPVAAPPAATRAASPVDPPQAAIPSKAGNGAEVEDFSALFGTLGLPNLRI